MLQIMRHQQGPLLSEEQKALRFRSYKEMAEWARSNLHPGVYWIRVCGSTSPNALREVHFRCGGWWGEGFYVSGRGTI